MIESYCDSDDEVFFGPMTMREIKVIFNLRDASKKKTEGGCSLVQTQETPTAESCEGEADDTSTDPSRPGGDQVLADGRCDIASASSMCGSRLLDEKIDTVLGQEMDGSSNNGSNVDCSVICGSSCSCSRCHNGQLDVACISIKESTCESVGVLAQHRSPFTSNCDEMDDTLEEINKLLALGDELIPAVISPKLCVGNVKNSAAVAQNAHDMCDEADVESASIIAQWKNDTDTQAHLEHQYSSDVFDQSVDPVVSQQADGSGISEHDVGFEVSEESKSDNFSRSEKSEKCSMLDERCRELVSDSSEVSSSTDTRNKCETGSACTGSNASWDKENVESRYVAGRQVTRNCGERAVFAPPWRVGGTAQRPTTRRPQYSPGARNKYAVQSPVGVYIRSSPAPSLVQNIRPTQRRATKASCTPDCKKVLVEAALPTSSSLPVVRYASKSARVLVSKQHSAQKLPPSVKKLIDTPEPLVTRHQGRFRLKYLPELRADVSSSDTEVSILVQKAAVKTRTPP